MSTTLQKARAPAKSDQSVSEAKVIYKTFKKITLNDTLANLARALDHEPYVLVTTEQRCFNGERVETKMVVSGIITRIDILHFVSNSESSGIV